MITGGEFLCWQYIAICQLKFPLQQDHLRMKVAPDQAIILGLQIFLDHRSYLSKVPIDGAHF